MPSTENWKPTFKLYIHPSMAINRVRALNLLTKTKYALSHYVQVNGFSSSSSSHQVSSSHFESVGFIGLGNMGSRMAKNLINNGFRLTVHDINKNILKMFAEIGVETKETPFEVAEASDVVITMLPSSSHVLDVYTGRKGLLGGNLLRPKLLIDSSTVHPQTSRKISEAVSNCTLKENRDWEKPMMLDAPVSGGILGAEAGTLTFIVRFDAILPNKGLVSKFGPILIIRDSYCSSVRNKIFID
ncbi:hypothetical protein Tsubulata_029085 [Turnera subulata]|uniref:3-hydroxyisobutyrate dehydrogenase n=1 Tax=Turnera subulata TaxID=218843 RepID=A0A9Q0G7N5_9ROSI|nr:hypothetical protein Tsubulata_029085 [Turnera subulata]